MNNELKIRTLTERFLDGATTLEEEQWLYDCYRKGEVPDDLLPLRSVFLGLDAISLQENEKAIEKKFPWHRLVAAVITVLIILTGGIVYNHYQQQEECVAYIYGEKCTDRQVVMEELQRGITEMATVETVSVEQQLNDLFGIN